MIKIFIFYIVKSCLSVFKFFPINENAFFFISYEGRYYSCNPRAIYEYISVNYDGQKLIWCLEDNVDLPIFNYNNKVIKIRKNTLRYFYYIITSKYVFFNSQLSSYIPKKKFSIWINTWHGGGAYKKVEYPEINLYTKLTKKIQIKNTDYYISSSEKFTEVMSKSTGIPKEKFLSIGMPRNDIFFETEDKKKITTEHVRNRYGIKNTDFCVLYAPTYRGNLNSGDFENNVDIDRIKGVFEKKFNKNVVFLIRTHHAAGVNIDLKSTINVTDYPDMQDLLVATDCLITDYSSCIWDFALTKKPAFLFTPDLEMYMKNRGLYMDINDWCFDYSMNNKELSESILNYNSGESFIKIDKYLDLMKNYDIGNSNKLLMDRILNK